MIKKIDMGKTYLKDLHQVFKFSNQDALENKKARLFPSGNTDNEILTTSIFLASLSAVKEYREELFLSIGINKIKTRNVNLHVFTEINDSDSSNIPDGLIVISSGKSNPVIEWAGFIEAKVRDNSIEESQVERYVKFSRDIGINSIITISNQLVTTPMDSPVKTSKRSFELYHWSWTYLKVTASRLIRTNQVADEDHVFILKELRRYFDSHKNLNNYTNMGKEWKDSVNKIHLYEKAQKIDQKTLNSLVASYVQEEKDLALQLTDQSQFQIELMVKDDRKAKIEEMLQSQKLITSDYCIDKNKQHKFSVDVDFIRQNITCYTTVTIDRGKAQAQTSALIRMLEAESGRTENILVNAFYLRNKCNRKDVSVAQLIEEKNQGEYYSVLEKDFGDQVKFFEIKTTDKLGKDFQSNQKFIVKLESIASVFLTQVMQNINK
ncbi:MAG: hypothetical protein RQ867_05250 [Mariprofundaceae bacterium]|nr:hypothetical protein [Mariprofundaceae bacterium]